MSGCGKMFVNANYEVWTDAKCCRQHKSGAKGWNGPAMSLVQHNLGLLHTTRGMEGFCKTNGP